MKYEISVIIPTYNNDLYIERCINSLLNQTYKDIEIIIVDDGSTDQTEKIIRKKYNSLENIKYYKNKNNGVSFSRNYGINNSSGNYIMFLDGDDWLDKDYISNCYYFLKENDLDIVKTGYVIDYENKQTIKEPFNKSIPILNNQVIQNTFITTTFFNSCWGQLINRQSIGNIRFSENIICGEDLLFCIQLYNITEKIGFLSQNYYHYFFNSSSITKNKLPEISLQKCYDIIEVIYSFYKYNFSKSMIASKLYFEIEHYLRKYIIESNFSYSTYKKVIQEILGLDKVKLFFKDFKFIQNKDLYSLKKWFLVFMLLHNKTLYLIILKLYK